MERYSHRALVSGDHPGNAILSSELAIGIRKRSPHDLTPNPLAKHNGYPKPISLPYQPRNRDSLFPCHRVKQEAFTILFIDAGIAQLPHRLRHRTGP